MTGLLVSVRSAAEAAIALEAGADLIDVKEPDRGALGAATPGVWQEVATVIAGRRPLSVALGELLTVTSSEVIANHASFDGVTFAKIGLAGCREIADWRQRWWNVLQQLPSHVQPVAVAYADHNAAAAPAPQQVLTAARECGCGVLLVDTFHKNLGDLFAQLTRRELSELAEQTRDCGLRLVLAGSLRLETLDQALELEPDFVAVRGAACRGARNANICGDLIRTLVRQISGPGESLANEKFAGDFHSLSNAQ